MLTLNIFGHSILSSSIFWLVYAFLSFFGITFGLSLLSRFSARTLIPAALLPLVLSFLGSYQWVNTSKECPEPPPYAPFAVSPFFLPSPSDPPEDRLAKNESVLCVTYGPNEVLYCLGGALQAFFFPIVISSLVILFHQITQSSSNQETVGKLFQSAGSWGSFFTPFWVGIVWKHLDENSFHEVDFNPLMIAGAGITGVALLLSLCLGPVSRMTRRSTP